MITVIIDELTPCLLDMRTNSYVKTEVIRLRRESFLKNFSSEYWYADWDKLVKTNEVYAVVLEGTMQIQGLVALHDDPANDIVNIQWMVAAPTNNPMMGIMPQYKGVGGHLFAIACKRSLDLGHGGAVYGKAANKKLFDHYCNMFNGKPVGIGYFQFAIFEKDAKIILDSYSFKMCNEEV